MEVVVMPNELTGRFNIIPVAKSKLHNKLKKEKIHLICGGGTGAFLMEKLIQNNYKVSCGVLNIGDGDWNKARDLGLEIAYEAPFSPISKKALEVNESLIKKSDVIILMPLPFGPGNICNLEQVNNALKMGKKVIVVGNKTLENRDFTNGKAQIIYNCILDSGAIVASEIKDIFNKI
jgi:iron complex transport system ATP-binding protein